MKLEEAFSLKKYLMKTEVEGGFANEVIAKRRRFHKKLMLVSLK
jgi:hypothetical protein